MTTKALQFQSLIIKYSQITTLTVKHVDSLASQMSDQSTKTHVFNMKPLSLKNLQQSMGLPLSSAYTQFTNGFVRYSLYLYRLKKRSLYIFCRQYHTEGNIQYMQRLQLLFSQIANFAPYTIHTPYKKSGMTLQYNHTERQSHFVTTTIINQIIQKNPSVRTQP